MEVRENLWTLSVWKCVKCVAWWTLSVLMLEWSNESFPYGSGGLHYYFFLMPFNIKIDGSRTRVVLPLYYTPTIVLAPKFSFGLRKDRVV